MRLVSILIVAIIPYTSSTNTSVYEKCGDCNYQGGVSKVMLDSQTGNYKLSTIELGEFLTVLSIEKCNLTNKNKLELYGHTVTSVPKGGELTSPVNNIDILLCTLEGDYFIVQNKLANSDNSGRFALNLRINEKNMFIMVKQEEAAGIIYSLSDFIEKK